eukprot:2004987-Rhodomonas_salina.1
MEKKEREVAACPCAPTHLLCAVLYCPMRCPVLSYELSGTVRRDALAVHCPVLSCALSGTTRRLSYAQSGTDLGAGTDATREASTGGGRAGNTT